MLNEKRPFSKSCFLTWIWQKKHPGKINLIYRASFIFICLLVVFFIGSCEMKQHNQDKAATHYAMIDRLDRQNDVYYRLANQIDKYIYSDDKNIEEQQFRSFCRGVNCFVRDKRHVWDLYSQDEDFIKKFNEMISATAWGNLEEFSLANLNDDDLNELKDIFYQLSNECNRGVDHSFASCFAAQDFDTETYSEATERVERLLSSLKIMIG